MSQYGRVTHDYAAVNDDELNLTQGNIVFIDDPEPWEGWCHGQSEGCEGYFPGNFFEYIDDNDPDVIAFNQAYYGAADSGYEEPELKPKEEASVSDRVKRMSAVGGAGGMGALLNGLKKQESSNSYSSPTPSGGSDGPTKIFAEAHHNYDAANDDELSFSPGDRMEVIDQSHEDWWQGILNGNQGWFPSNFVDIVVVSAKTSRNSSFTAPKDNKQPLVSEAALSTAALHHVEPNQVKKNNSFGRTNTKPSVISGVKKAEKPPISSSVDDEEDKIPPWKKELMARKKKPSADSASAPITKNPATASTSQPPLVKPSTMAKPPIAKHPTANTTNRQPIPTKPSAVKQDSNPMAVPVKPSIPVKKNSSPTPTDNSNSNSPTITSEVPSWKARQKMFESTPALSSSGNSSPTKELSSGVRPGRATTVSGSPSKSKPVAASTPDVSKDDNFFDDIPVGTLKSTTSGRPKKANSRPPSRIRKDTENDFSINDPDKKMLNVNELSSQLLALVGEVNELKKQLAEERAARLQLEEKVNQLL